MTPVVSVLTPTIPSRVAMLEECRRSVSAQTFKPIEHLVLLDEARQGCSWTMNRLAEKARGAWLLPLADDDLILPRCVELLVSHANNGDIIYSRPLVWGNGSDHFFDEPPRIPSFALVRRDLWFELGGYEEGIVREEDRGLWTRALEAGATFVRVSGEPTWVYRFHRGSDGHIRNKSYNAGVAL